MIDDIPALLDDLCVRMPSIDDIQMINFTSKCITQSYIIEITNLLLGLLVVFNFQIHFYLKIFDVINTWAVVQQHHFYGKHFCSEWVNKFILLLLESFSINNSYS